VNTDELEWALIKAERRVAISPRSSRLAAGRYGAEKLPVPDRVGGPRMCVIRLGIDSMRHLGTGHRPGGRQHARIPGSPGPILRNNLRMADVPVWVAVITAAAGVIGAAIPQVAIVVRDVRQGERDRRERLATATLDACVELLRAAGELRTLSEGIRSYCGPADGMRARIDEVRSLAEATRLNSARVSTQVPDLAEAAYRVASAGSALAHSVVEGTDPVTGVFVGELDVDQLVKCVTDFQDGAVKQANGQLARKLRRFFFWLASSSAASR
jgi:hypothetical protein